MDSFFSDNLQDFAIKYLVAALCGAVFGLERQLRGKPFGVRTCVLIAVGTSLFVTLGSEISGPGVDPTRVLGQIVTGIGFLGAGSILSHRGQVQGITSAAVIWMIAAVGACVGLGQFSIAFFSTIVSVTLLLLCTKIEHSVVAMQKGVHKLSLKNDE